MLGAGVVKRYEGRLLPVAKFLECAALAELHENAFSSLVTTKARLTETTLRLTVLGPTADAARFAEKTPGTPCACKDTAAVSPKTAKTADAAFCQKTIQSPTATPSGWSQR